MWQVHEDSARAARTLECAPPLLISRAPRASGLARGAGWVQPFPMSLRPILLAIVGDSAAGKSTLGDGIAALLGDQRVTVVTTDDYHKHNRKERRELRLSALHPDCNDLDLLGEHLAQLASGNAVEKAPYNHATGDFDAPRRIAPAEFLIVEGLLGLHSQALRDRYDVSVYLDTPEPLRH